MGLFWNKHKIFISHKRVNGDASADALLIKRILDTRPSFDNFMDVHQDTLGEFPVRLKNEIFSSNTFIFVIPSDGDVSFLRDKNKKGWVYKEINYATYKKLLGDNKKRKKEYQILPVTFANNFKWPDDLPEEISTICNYDICKLHYNDKPNVTQEKLFRAINHRWWNCFNWIGIVLSLLFLLVIAVFVLIGHQEKETDQLNKERIEFIRSSWENNSINRIQPSIIIPKEKRTTFEDSLYHYFELRDQLFVEMEKLPLFNMEVKNDMFTKNNMSRMIKAHYDYIDNFQRFYSFFEDLIMSYKHALVITLSGIRNKVIEGRFSDEEFKQLMEDADKMKKVLDEINNEFKQIKYYYNVYINKIFSNKAMERIENNLNHGNIEKVLKLISKFFLDSEYWEKIDEERVLLEKGAVLFNFYFENQIK